MLRRLMFLLFLASYGWPLAVGVVVAAPLIDRAKWPAAVAVLLAAVVVATVVFRRVDLPRWRAMRQAPS
ncbi:MAG: hypothetical protein ACRCSN_08140 [Dermatophilaceae bacterium]